MPDNSGFLHPLRELEVSVTTRVEPVLPSAKTPNVYKMSQSLFEKVWNSHSVKNLSNGQTQLLIGTHLIHEVTSPQAFGMLRDLGLKVKFPNRTFATVDHIVPTRNQVEPFEDKLAQEMIQALRDNCKEFGVKFFDIGSGGQGIVHVVGPEPGITQTGRRSETCSPRKRWRSAS